MFICRGGAVISEQALKAHCGSKYDMMKKSFTRTTDLPFDRKRITKLVTRNDKGYLIMYRFLAEQYHKLGLIPNITSKLSDGEPIVLPDLKISPYKIQHICHNHLVNHYFNDKRANMGFGGAILELEAGLGKTFVAAMITKTLSVKTLYIVVNKYLLNQAIDDFKKCFGDIKIGQYHSTKKTDGDIVFMVINSVIGDSFILDGVEVSASTYFSRFGLTIWDEVHEYASNKRLEAFTTANTKYMLGITAEANNREDNCDFITHYGIGPVVSAIDIPDFEVPINERYTSSIRIVHYYGHPDFTKHIENEKNGLMMASEMSKQMMSDPHRVHFIIREIDRMYKQGKNLFVWCDVRDAVYLITKILVKLGYTSVEGVGDVGDAGDVGDVGDVGDAGDAGDVGVLMGNISNNTLKKSQSSRIIVATYQYACRGVSLPKFDAMIFATPRKAKIYQTLKRIFRMGGDMDSTREVVDIVDERTGLRKQILKRLVEYEKDIFNATITHEKIKYDEIELVHPEILSLLAS